jgi:hypothetical protein
LGLFFRRRFYFINQVGEIMEVDKFLGRTYLGTLCERGHNNGNGFSARYVTDRGCIACHQERNKHRRKTDSPLPTTQYRQQIACNRKIALERSDTTYLGGICLRKHDFEGTGFSKRYTLDRDCTACRRNGKRAGATSRDDRPILSPKAPKEAKPKSEGKAKEPRKKKKKENRPAAVPIYVSPTIDQEKIAASYRQRMAELKRIEYQMKREEKL